MKHQDRIRGKRVRKFLDLANVMPNRSIGRHQVTAACIGDNRTRNVADSCIANQFLRQIDFGNPYHRAPRGAQGRMGRLGDSGRTVLRVGPEYLNGFLGGSGSAESVAQAIHNQKHARVPG